MASRNELNGLPWWYHFLCLFFFVLALPMIVRVIWSSSFPDNFGNFSVVYGMVLILLPCLSTVLVWRLKRAALHVATLNFLMSIVPIFVWQAPLTVLRLPVIYLVFVVLAYRWAKRG
jgi:hypothetical protein